MKFLMKCWKNYRNWADFQGFDQKNIKILLIFDFFLNISSLILSWQSLGPLAANGHLSSQPNYYFGISMNDFGTKIRVFAWFLIISEAFFKFLLQFYWKKNSSTLWRRVSRLCSSSALLVNLLRSCCCLWSTYLQFLILQKS